LRPTTLTGGSASSENDALRAAALPLAGRSIYPQIRLCSFVPSCSLCSSRKVKFNQLFETLKVTNSERTVTNSEISGDKFRTNGDKFRTGYNLKIGKLSTEKVTNSERKVRN
jgi:hypothetical protein